MKNSVLSPEQDTVKTIVGRPKNFRFSVLLLSLRTVRDAHLRRGGLQTLSSAQSPKLSKPRRLLHARALVMIWGFGGDR